MDGFWVVDTEGRLLEVNETYCRMSGYSAQELLAMPISELAANEAADDTATRNKRIMTQGESRFESRHRRKDGGIYDVEVSAQYRPTEGGRYVGFLRDITERKRAEEELRAKEHMLSESQRIAHVGSWNWDLATGILTWTPETYRLHGVSPDTFVPSRETLLGLIHPDDRAATQTWIGACLAGEKPPDLEFRSSLPAGGVRNIHARGYLVLDAENKPIRMAGIAQDVTERKRMEDAIRGHSEELARSNAELERFAYVASHDLQEPLRMVASFTQLLAKRYSGKLDETANRYIEYAVDGAKRMQQLIADLLAYSRVSNKEIDLRQTECEAVVQSAMRNLTMVIDESGASVDWDPLPSLWADQAQLTQLFQNLFGNAIKFRRNGERPRIHISAAYTGAEWVLSVQDNGIGIEPLHADRVFQIFQRLHTRAEYPGTGIGLAVCKKVVERHGGKIWVESEPGAGSTFRFTIPKPENGVGDARNEQASRDSVD
jgi:PAS domain S-box-containing protein